MTNFAIEKNVDGQFYATFTGDNGEMVWKTSEFYPRKQKALKAIGIICASSLKRILYVVDNSLKTPTERSYYVSDLLKK